MKRKTLLLHLLILFLFAAQPVSALPQSTLPGGPQGVQPTHWIYMPVISGTFAPPDSLDDIEEDLAAGKLDQETATIYKVFAAFGDPRLPAAYQGQVDPGAGDGIFREAARLVGTFSAAGQATLEPFFLPPNDPASWHAAQSAAGGTLQPQLLAGWQSLPAASGKVKIWYDSGDPDGLRQATVVQAEMNKSIWPELTTLMNKEPKPGEDAWSVLNIYLSGGGYTKLDGTVVPWDGTRGVAQAADCQNTSAWISINKDRPDGSETSAGIIQTVAHEFFHAIQYAYPLAACPHYDWVAEATAKWAEDYVYPDADSEQPYAPNYLDYPHFRLDNQQDAHHYGAYLFPYFLTHTTDTTSVIIRKIWENGATYANSYKAIQQAVPEEQRDHYWTLYMWTLWNQSPMNTYYWDADTLADTVKPQQPDPIAVTLSNGAFTQKMGDDLPVGGLRYYHFTFPDSSVRGVTVLNGIGKKISKVSAWDVMNGMVEESDQAYKLEDLTPEQQQGANISLLMKVEGVGWRPIPLSGQNGELQTERHSICLDEQGKVEEMVVVLSNSDWDHPDRVMQPAGEPTMLIADNMPCYGMQGTSKITYYNYGVVETISASFKYGRPSAWPQMTPEQLAYLNAAFLWPENNMIVLLEANATWTIEGTDTMNDCSYSGSGSYSASEQPGAGSETIVFLTGLLPGGPSYRGYYGFGDPEDPPDIAYTAVCPDGEGGTETFNYTERAPRFFEIPYTMDRENIKVGANGSTLSGTYKYVEEYSSESYTIYEWNLTALSK